MSEEKKLFPRPYTIGTDNVAVLKEMLLGVESVIGYTSVATVPCTHAPLVAPGVAMLQQLHSTIMAQLPKEIIEQLKQTQAAGKPKPPDPMDDPVPLGVK